MSIAEALVNIKFLHKRQIARNGRIGLFEAKFRIQQLSASDKERIRVSYQNLLPSSIRPEYLSIRDASEKTKLKPEKIQKLCRDKRIVAKKEKRMWSVYMPSLYEYIRQNQ